MIREEGYELILQGKKSQEQVAKLLGVSRQRVGQLYRRWLKTRIPHMKPTGKAVTAPALNPSSPDPLEKVFTPEPPAESSAPPQNVADVLRPVGAVPDLPPSQPSVVVVDAKPFEPSTKQTDIEKIDPEDASAGRELVTYGTRLIREYAARCLRVKEEEAAKENEFLRVAMKRNSEKFHLLGWLTKGWKGLVIGGIVDVIRMALLAPVDNRKQESEPGEPKAAEPVAPEEPTPIGEEAEPAAPKRPTLAEKVQRMRGE